MRLWACMRGSNFAETDRMAPPCPHGGRQEEGEPRLNAHVGGRMRNPDRIEALAVP